MKKNFVIAPVQLSEKLQQKIPLGMILGSIARSLSRTVSFTERQNETEQGLWFTSGSSTERYPPTTISPTSTRAFSAWKNTKYCPHRYFPDHMHVVTQ